MQIVLDESEEAAVSRYAERKNLTYDQAFKQIIDAMTQGLISLIIKDEIDIDRETTNKTLDISSPDSDSA